MKVEEEEEEEEEFFPRGGAFEPFLVCVDATHPPSSVLVLSLSVPSSSRARSLYLPIRQSTPLGKHLITKTYCHMPDSLIFF